MRIPSLTRRHLAALAAASLLTLAGSRAWAQDSIQLGAVIPLTGPSATVGEDIRRGIMLGVEEVNARGGVLGRKLQVIIEDSGNNPATALTAARKLATVDKVPAVMGEYSSSITLPMAQYLVKEGVTHLNIGSSSAKIRGLGGSAFNIIGLEDAGNRYAARDAYDMGWRRMATVSPNNAYGQGVAEGFKSEFEKLGGKVVAQVLYTGGQSTFRRELQQLSRSQPDAYLYTAYGQESAVINREARELGLRSVPWYAYIMSMSVSDTPPDIAEGQVGMELGSARGEAGRAYRAAYRARYKEDFKSAFSGYGHDAVLLLAAAIDKAGASTSADIQKGLKQLGAGGFAGATGPIAFDAQNQRIDPPYDKLRFVGGRLAPR